MTIAGVSTLANLPPELYSVVLDHVPPRDLQHTTQALRVALPRSPVPPHQTFQHIHIDTKEQVKMLWRRLRLTATESIEHNDANWVQSLELAEWNPDADILINTVRLIPQLRYVHVHIGTTFSPEHLEDLFHYRYPQTQLRLLSMRFRPYVEKATYYQFLKGSYSDSMIEHIAKWPVNPALEHLSIVQDPLPSGAFAPQKSFAQPIVFFSLDPFRPLSSSPLSSTITHLRVRIPSRPVINFLADPGSFPLVKVLDLSTTTLGRDAERSIPSLLARLPNLRHLVVDGCSLSREGWRELGKACAVAGLAKARAREKSLRTWIEAHKAHNPPAGEDLVPVVSLGQGRRPRRGRRGIATSNISFRAPSPPRASASTSRASSAAPDASVTNAKIRILPPPPRLLTFSTSLRPAAEAIKRAEWTREWETGWNMGVETIRAVWARLGASARNASMGVRLMQFDERGYSLGEDVEGFKGLVDVVIGSEKRPEWMWQAEAPIICFGEPRMEGDNEVEDVEVDADGDLSEEEESIGDPMMAVEDGNEECGDGHAIGCGHVVAENAWDLYGRIEGDRR